MDPAESHLPFFPLGFIFFHASKQNSGHGHVALGTGCFGLMELPLNHQISSLLLDLPTCLYPQGERGYVLGGVEVIPGRNGQPGPPVSIKPQVWGSLQLSKAWQSSHIPPSPAFPCCRDRRGSRGVPGVSGSPGSPGPPGISIKVSLEHSSGMCHRKRRSDSKNCRWRSLETSSKALLPLGVGILLSWVVSLQDFFLG